MSVYICMGFWIGERYDTREVLISTASRSDNDDGKIFHYTNGEPITLGMEIGDFVVMYISAEPINKVNE